MVDDDKKISQERNQTNEGLRTERARTDRVLAEKQELDQKDADKVVQRARENADAVLIAAREKADQRVNETAGRPPAQAVVAEERELEDEALQRERAAADENLRSEREKSARALLGLLPMERDKTDRYLLVERERSDVAVSNRDDFLSIASHDLRDLLSGIVMSAALLATRAAEHEQGGNILTETQRIQRYCARMNRLIGDLVDVASIDAGKLAVALGRGDPTALIAEAVDTFQAAASAKSISLDMELGERSVVAEFDHERMLQVLANLITNSIKFTPEGGKILVRVERMEDELRFSVRDTGKGVPDHMLEAIFERFWQVGQNDRRGLGLGLYISRCIVEAHGGTIWAESKLGEGSSVFFLLPVAPGSLHPGLTELP